VWLIHNAYCLWRDYLYLEPGHRLVGYHWQLCHGDSLHYHYLYGNSSRMRHCRDGHGIC
jgi:hypothetical protein